MFALSLKKNKQNMFASCCFMSYKVFLFKTYGKRLITESMGSSSMSTLMSYLKRLTCAVISVADPPATIFSPYFFPLISASPKS